MAAYQVCTGFAYGIQFQSEELGGGAGNILEASTDQIQAIDDVRDILEQRLVRQQFFAIFQTPPHPLAAPRTPALQQQGLRHHRDRTQSHRRAGYDRIEQTEGGQRNPQYIINKCREEVLTNLP